MESYLKSCSCHKVWHRLKFCGLAQWIWGMMTVTSHSIGFLLGKPWVGATQRGAFGGRDPHTRDLGLQITTMEVAVIGAECESQLPSAHGGQPSCFPPGAELARPVYLFMMSQGEYSTGCGDISVGTKRQQLRATHSQSFTEGDSLEHHCHVHYKQAAACLSVPQGDRNFYWLGETRAKAFIECVPRALLNTSFLQPHQLFNTPLSHVRGGGGWFSPAQLRNLVQ